MREKLYLDTHFIDYLWDHRGAIWEDDDRSLERAREDDGSEQVAEYKLVRELPLLSWWNDWLVVIGDEVMRQLGAISKPGRREALLGYAERIASMSMLNADGVEPTSARFRDPHLSAAIDGFPVTDRAIVRDALDRRCTVILTTDRGVLRAGQRLRDVSGVRVQRLTEFVDEEAGQGRLRLPFGPEGLMAGGGAPSTLPDISLYTWFIPAGDLIEHDNDLATDD